jgi:release factor glutamine methyltransferase
VSGTSEDRSAAEARSARSAAGPVTWRELLVETAEKLGSDTEARWVCQEASGLDGAEWALGLGTLATQRGVARLDAMVARRTAGEPLQYVLGHWPFRGLDLLIDRRVLIPRPETEQLVDVALRLARAMTPPLAVADLGTGSGAIALALANELPLGTVTVWAGDASEAAVGVARANLAGIGRAAVHVRLARGSWYDALPPDLAGSLDLVVSNPPYVATGDPEVDEVVRGWEPADAVFAGDDGLDALRVVIGGARTWLKPAGALVCEIGAGQADTVVELATAAGLASVDVEPDAAGHARFLVARG